MGLVIDGFVVFGRRICCKKHRPQLDCSADRQKCSSYTTTCHILLTVNTLLGGFGVLVVRRSAIPSVSGVLRH